MNEHQLRAYLISIALTNGWTVKPSQRKIEIMRKKQLNGKPLCPCRAYVEGITDPVYCPCDSAKDDIKKTGTCYCELFAKL